MINCLKIIRKKGFKMKLFITIATICLLISGCSGFRAKKNEIIDNYYYNYRGSYCFKMPEMQSGMQIEQYYMSERTFNGVIIRDDFGNLVRIEDDAFPEEDSDLLAKYILENSCQEVLTSIFQNCVFMAILKQFPSTQVLEEKFVDINGIGQAYFAIIDIPGGSNMQNANTGQKADSRRVYMISFCENHLVVLSMQESLLVQEWRKRNAIDSIEINQELYDKLIDLRKSYKIIN